MHKHTAAFAVMISLALVSPSTASAQLTGAERARAEEVARINARAQAKADANQRARQAKTRRDAAQTACRSSGRVWDHANDACVRNPILR